MISWLLLLSLAVNICGEETVKFAAIIFRHGDRTPVAPYPTDPYKNESNWPVKFGQLTNIGKTQHFAFGKWIRERYPHLVSEFYDQSEIYVRSTDVDRTLMSAEANLAGMYPPREGAVWNPALMWQPIPVHTVPESEDEVLAMKRSCPAYDEEYKKYIRSVEFQGKLDHFRVLMTYLSKHSGMEIKGYDDIMDLYSTLYIEKLYNFTLPSWTYSVFPRLMHEPACYSFTVETGTPKLANLKAGPLLQHIHKYMIKAVNSTNGKHRKLAIYSGHDITIGNLLNALGMFDGECPSYTAAVFIEVVFDHENSSHYVKISYRNSIRNVEPVVLNIPDCDEKCSVDRFSELYEDLLHVNWEKECGTGILLYVLFACLGFFFVIASTHIYHKTNVELMYRRELRNEAYASFLAASITPLKLIDDDVTQL